jgi:hypothetical protein
MNNIQKSISEGYLISTNPYINYTHTTKSNKKFDTINKFESESPKNFNLTGGINIHTVSNTNNNNNINPLYTNNSFGLGLINKKFSITNNNKTNSSKLGTTNSSMSKNPITNYISSSTLQSCFPSYSIPKEKRFDDNYNKSICDSIYNLPEYKRIGISMPLSIRKNPFIKKDKTPSSQDYVLTTIFDDNLKHKKGISISTKFSKKVNKYYFI